MRHIVTRSLAILAGAPIVAASQVPPFTMTKVADGIYTTVRRDEMPSPADGNSTLIVNDRDVIVVDANLTASSARAVLSELRKITSKPVRYVIATHWHDDHVSGAQVYLRAFPMAEFVSHPATRDSIEREVIPSMKKNLEIEYPSALEGLRKRLASGKRRDGAPLTAEDSTALHQAIVSYEYWMKESRGVTLAIPTVTVDSHLTIHRGERTIEIRFLGRGNTAGDLVVQLPRERTVITGDLLVAPTPYAYGSYLGDWRRTLRSLRSLPVDVVIPGHGPPQRDWSYLDLVDELLASVLSQTRDAVAKGLDLEAARKAIDVHAIRAKFTGTDRLKIGAFETNFMEPAVERAYLEAQGRVLP
jgi:cyclase